MDISVSLAQPHEVSTVLSLLKDAARWLHERKIEQWAYLRDGGEDEEILAGILSGKTFLARRGGGVAGTFTLYDQQSDWDAYIWDKRSDSAVYLHRLAVARSERGRGIGGKLIGWIEQECRKEAKAFLRLDCVAGNERLNRYYADHGFISQGISHHHTMFQRQLDASIACFSARTM